MDDFEKELKTGFLVEASQLLGDTEQCFLSLEATPDDGSLLDKIFRLAHNLKGSSKAVGFDDMGAFTHELESFLLKLKSGDLKVRSETVSLLLRCNDHLRKMVEALSKDLGARTDCSELIREIQAEASVDPGEKAPDALFDELAEITQAEVAQLKIPEAPAAAQPVPAQSSPASSGSGGAGPVAQAPDESIRVSLARLEKLLNFVGELVILQTVLREQSLGSNPALLRKTAHQMGKVTKEIQDISMSLRMVPVKQTFQKMQRIVRDTSTALGKKVQLNLQGEETELDKTVLENLSDPLVHMIRNAVDHGVESPEVRQKTGKSEAGNILLQAFHQSGKLIIEVIDDGGGIDPERLREKAIEKGIIKPDAQLTQRQAIELIFHPGFSTKAAVTDISGRGVGMDVVKTNIERLQGEVQVESEVGKGTTMRVILPLTLAIIDGMIVKSQEDRFVIPLSHVHESVKPASEDVKKITGVGEVLMLRGETLPLYKVADLLGRRKKEQASADAIAIVLRSQGNPFAVLVDDIIGQHQVVIKKLGGEIQNVKGLAGSAILGDGKPALILELSELIHQLSPTQGRISA